MSLPSHKRGLRYMEPTWGWALAGLFWSKVGARGGACEGSLPPTLFCATPCLPQTWGPVGQVGLCMGGSPHGHTPNSLCPPHSNNPDDVAMRLAFIGDEMEVRWMLPRVGELPGMAMYRWCPPQPSTSCPTPAPGPQTKHNSVPFSASSSSQDCAFPKGS